MTYIVSIEITAALLTYSHRNQKLIVMEIENMDARLYEMLIQRFEEFTRKVGELCDAVGDKRLSKWLDNQDVCMMLNISKRTLQSYRDNGTIPFTRIENKIYYRPDDIEKVVKRLSETKKNRP